MSAQFQDLHIVGLVGESCYAVEGSVLRIHLKLSGAPPIGWAYVFSQVWQTVEYPDKRRVGIESDILWIECAPEEVRDQHLPHLEWALQQANARYGDQRQQKELALERQRELSRQTQMKLEDLARSFAPARPTVPDESWETPPPQLRGGRLANFLRRLLAPTARKRGGRNNEVTHWKANNFAAQFETDS